MIEMKFCKTLVCITTLSAVPFLSACTSNGVPVLPEPFGTRDVKGNETEPVTVETAKGIVVCQLYGAQTVLWDRAIDYPNDMDYREADNYCRRAGHIAKEMLKDSRS